MKILSGVEIVSVHPQYENVIISTGTGDVDSKIKIYYIDLKMLSVILSEFDFIVRKKRTRDWIEINIDDWRIERFDEPRSY